MLYQGLEHAMHYYVPTGLVMLVMALIGRGGTSAYVSFSFLFSSTESNIEAVALRHLGNRRYPRGLSHHRLQPLLIIL